MEQLELTFNTNNTQKNQREIKPLPQRNWQAYNQYQRTEKGVFLSLLFELCEGIEEPIQSRGRKRASLRDLIFAMTLKNYTLLSGRRNSTDIQDAFEKGYIEKPYHYNTIFKYLQDERITDLLQKMIETSCQPLKSIEKDFAIDATGFGTPQYKRWYGIKYGGDEDWRDWYKLNICCGVQTGIITSFIISERYSHDGQFFKPLFDSTLAHGFDIQRVFADKAYPSRTNLRLVVDNNATPYIPFKKNAKYDPRDTVWNKLLHYYCAFKEEFYETYHLRSNVESVFSAMKKKFGHRLTCRNRTAQFNEMMAKLLAYNLCVLARSICELRVEVDFSR
jgi:transposase